MPISDQAVGQRVRDVRATRGLGQSELARRAGMERTALVKVEAGRRRLSVAEAGDLAEALDVALPLLLAPAADVVSRRQTLGMPPSAQDKLPGLRLSLLLEEWAGDVDLLVGLGHLHPPDRPTAPVIQDRRAADAAARQLRPHLADRLAPLGRLTAVAERVGLYVRALDDSSVDGASIDQGVYGVAVVGRQDPGRRRATAAHELAHHLLGDAYSEHARVDAAHQEREGLVDLVGSRLLLPLEAVRAALPLPSSQSEARDALLRIAVDYRVSWSLVVAAAGDTGVLAADQSRGLLGDVPRRTDIVALSGSDVAEDLRLGDHGPAWVAAVAQAVRVGDISPSRALELLPGWRHQDLPDCPEDPGF